MPKKRARRSYSIELKKKAVDLSNQKGVTIAEVADELGVPASQISQWRQKLNGLQAAKDAEQKLDAIAECKALKLKLRQAEQEIEILKKAASYFASQK